MISCIGLERRHAAHVQATARFRAHVSSLSLALSLALSLSLSLSHRYTHVQATASFRAHVSSLPSISAQALADLGQTAVGSEGAFGLANWYNVWDQFNTWAATGGYAGNPMPDASALPRFDDGSIIPETGGSVAVPDAAGKASSLMAQVSNNPSPSVPHAADWS